MSFIFLLSISLYKFYLLLLKQRTPVPWRATVIPCSFISPFSSLLPLWWFTILVSKESLWPLFPIQIQIIIATLIQPLSCLLFPFHSAHGIVSLAIPSNVSLAKDSVRCRRHWQLLLGVESLIKSLWMLMNCKDRCLNRCLCRDFTDSVLFLEN